MIPVVDRARRKPKARWEDQVDGVLEIMNIKEAKKEKLVEKYVTSQYLDEQRKILQWTD